MEKIVLYFDDIDCAACSKKVENKLQSIDKFDEVVLDYLNKEIHISYHDLSKEEVIELANNYAKKVEPDVNIGLVPFEEDDHEEHHHEHDHHDHSDRHHKHHHFEFSFIYIIGAVFGLAAFIIQLINKNNPSDVLKILLVSFYTISYFMLAYEIIYKSFKGIIKGNIFNENFLMFIASFGAMVLSYLVIFKVFDGDLEFLEGVLVIFLYNIGEAFQDLALNNSREEIAELTNLKIEKTTLKDGRVVDTKEVKVGDEIIVKVGERVPLDGIILDNDSSFDTKVLTGESLPRDLLKGEEVLAGFINLSKVITVRVIRKDEESATSKINKMIKEATLKKSKTENFITKFAAIYTPIVIFLALAVFLIEWLAIDKFSIVDALNNSFVFLVSSCPCALVISIPLAFYGGIGRASSFGILIKGGNYLEVLAKTKHICFDKTGTLTNGDFKIKEINAENIDENELLKLMASIEINSNHPIAKAITDFVKDELYPIDNVEELAGHGLLGKYQDKILLCGNEKLMIDNHIDYEKEECPGSVVYCSYDGKYLGNILIVDSLKDNAKTLIVGLKNKGVKTYILTGDKKEIGKDVGDKLGIDEVYAELLPDDKLKKLEEIINKKESKEMVAYIGDGINDTPSLALADVGIAIGGFGHDEAIETSDVVLMNDEVDKINDVIDVAKLTMKVLKENIIFALGVKIIVMIIGLLGLLGSYGMFLGVFADVGVCLLCILNTIRIIKWRKK